MPPTASSEEKLEDLQRRYHLLEGERKSNLETVSTQIRSNKDTIRKLNEDNNRLRADIGHFGSAKRKESSEDTIKLNGRYNALRNENAKKSALIDQLRGQLVVAGGADPAGDTSEDRRVRVLENRIDKAMIKYNEAQSIKKTYEGILKRLQEERIGFDRQLQELEEQLVGKRKDYQELILLSHDAQHAKEIAQAELHRFEQAVLEERNQRDREVLEKKMLVQQRVEMNQRLEMREKGTKDEVVVGTGGAGPAGSGRDVAVPADTKPAEAPTRASNEELARAQQRLSDYEEGYKKLREITGVGDVNEIIQKFMTLEVTHEHLVKETNDQQAQLDGLTAEYAKLTGQLNELKFSGGAVGGGTNAKKQAIEDVEGLLAESSSKLEKNRTRYEKLAAILIDVNAGVGHLTDKLACIKLDANTRFIATDEATIVSDETIEEVLNVCELKIVKLMAQLDAGGIESTQGDPAYTPDVRVKIPSIDGLDEADFDPGHLQTNIGQENDVFNRKLFKQNSELFVEKIKKKQAAGGLKKPPGNK